MRKFLKLSIFFFLAVLAVVSVRVQIPAPAKIETLFSTGSPRVLILYHPSRDTGFSDDLSLAFAKGLGDAGMAVDRATLNAATPISPIGYAGIAVVSNTYYWTPDLPTLWYLGRARWNNLPAVALIGGAGATHRSQKMLNLAVSAAGGRLLYSQSYWLLRPNDESRNDASNRSIALEQATSLGSLTAAKLKKGG